MAVVNKEKIKLGGKKKAGKRRVVNMDDFVFLFFFRKRILRVSFLFPRIA